MLPSRFINTLLFLCLALCLNAKLYALDPTSRFKISGVIESALKKNGTDQSIVVLYDGQSKKTLVLKAGEDIAGTEFKIGKVSAKEVTLQDSYGSSYILRRESFDGPSTADTSRVAKRTSEDDWDDEFDDEGLGSDVYYDDLPSTQAPRAAKGNEGMVTTLPAPEGVAPPPAPDDMRYNKRSFKNDSKRSIRKIQ